MSVCTLVRAWITALELSSLAPSTLYLKEATRAAGGTARFLPWWSVSPQILWHLEGCLWLAVVKLSQTSIGGDRQLLRTWQRNNGLFRNWFDFVADLIDFRCSKLHSVWAQGLRRRPFILHRKGSLILEFSVAHANCTAARNIGSHGSACTCALFLLCMELGVEFWVMVTVSLELRKRIALQSSCTVLHSQQRHRVPGSWSAHWFFSRFTHHSHRAGWHRWASCSVLSARVFGGHVHSDPLLTVGLCILSCISPYQIYGVQFFFSHSIYSLSFRQRSFFYKGC